LKAICGAGISGIATAYFLEEIFNEQIDTIEIYIFDKEAGIQGDVELTDKINAQNSNMLHYNGHVYDLNPLSFVYITDFYIRKFAQKAGNFTVYNFKSYFIAGSFWGAIYNGAGDPCIFRITKRYQVLSNQNWI